jgi:hypothetical protein
MDGTGGLAEASAARRHRNLHHARRALLVTRPCTTAPLLLLLLGAGTFGVRSRTRSGASGWSYRSGLLSSYAARGVPCEGAHPVLRELTDR